MTGWIGPKRQLLHYLSTVRAERDSDGNFLIGGAPVSSYMGMDDDDNDVVVPGETWCILNGHQVPIAPGLNSTSYRMPVTVITADGEDGDYEDR